VNKTSKSKLKSYLSLLGQIESPTENYKLLLLYSKLYYSLSDKNMALLNANKAIQQGNLSKLDVREAKQILEDIEEL